MQVPQAVRVLDGQLGILFTTSLREDQHHDCSAETRHFDPWVVLSLSNRHAVEQVTEKCQAIQTLQRHFSDENAFKEKISVWNELFGSKALSICCCCRSRRELLHFHRLLIEFVGMKTLSEQALTPIGSLLKTSIKISGVRFTKCKLDLGFLGTLSSWIEGMVRLDDFPQSSIVLLDFNNHTNFMGPMEVVLLTEIVVNLRSSLTNLLLNKLRVRLERYDAARSFVQLMGAALLCGPPSPGKHSQEIANRWFTLDLKENRLDCAQIVTLMSILRGLHTQPRVHIALSLENALTNWNNPQDRDRVWTWMTFGIWEPLKRSTNVALTSLDLSRTFITVKDVELVESLLTSRSLLLKKLLQVEFPDLNPSNLVCEPDQWCCVGKKTPLRATPDATSAIMGRAGVDTPEVMEVIGEYAGRYLALLVPAIGVLWVHNCCVSTSPTVTNTSTASAPIASKCQPSTTENKLRVALLLNEMIGTTVAPTLLKLVSVVGDRVNSLEIKRNVLTGEQLKTVLTECPFLTFLDVEACGIQELEPFRHVFAQRPSPLRQLNLSRNPLGQAASLELTWQLMEQPEHGLGYGLACLRCINLEKTLLGVRGTNRIMSALENNTVLRKLFGSREDWSAVDHAVREWVVALPLDSKWTFLFVAVKCGLSDDLIGLVFEFAGCLLQRQFVFED